MIGKIEAKIVILGDQSKEMFVQLKCIDEIKLFDCLDVGKTSFVVVFNQNGEVDTGKLKHISSTIGASFVSCSVRVRDKAVKMQVIPL